MTIPNYITILRLLLVPIVVWAMLTGRELTALFGFIAAGVSDGVDGFIARRWNMKSELGTYMDPIADKLLLVSVFVVLAYQELVPIWLVAMVVFRDALIVSAVMLSAVMENPVEMRPLFVSKANTAAQILLVAVVLAQSGMNVDVMTPIIALTALVALLTAASTAAYLVTWLKHMADDGQETGKD
ncbi:MAG: CDP-alcohol phosphatidyltransferase family protein [Rhizobiaceae bacterium]